MDRSPPVVWGLMALVAACAEPPVAPTEPPAVAALPPLSAAAEPLDDLDPIEVHPVDTEDTVAVGADAIPVGDAQTVPVDPASPGQPARQLESPVFEVIEIPGLSDHVVAAPVFDPLGYGAGSALFDLDGDGDLDVLLGQTHDEGEPACVYENQSSPGALSFLRRDDLCAGDALADVVGGQAIDLDHDGIDELVVYGHDVLTLVRFAPVAEQVELFGLRDVPADRRKCPVAAVQPYDVDLDGHLDLLVACHIIIEETRFTNYDNFVLRGTQDGFEAMDEADALPFSDEGNTLAYGVADVDGDGLDDVLMINDTFSRPQRRNFGMLSGGWVRRCGPTEACTFETTPWARRSAQYGSMMGIHRLRIADEDWFYILDWGPNRLVRFEDDGPVDGAFEHGVQLARHDDAWSFAWGAAVDDFNADGLDDLLVTQGAVIPVENDHYGDHFDALLLQNADGRFELFSSDAGLRSFATTLEAGMVPSSRALSRADLDGDGRLELLVNTNRGARTIYQERAPRERCTVRPAPSVVASAGVGYSYHAAEGEPWIQDLIGGAYATGHAPALTTRSPAGEVRFPSGAVVPFACGDDGRGVVTEPEWLEVTVDGLTASIGVDPAVVDAVALSAVARDASGVVRELDVLAAAGGWEVTLTPSDEAVMVALDGRWVARWFALP